MADTVYGIPADELPEGVVVSDVVCVLKAIDEDGDSGVYLRRTPGLAYWDAVGMLTIALDTLRNQAQEFFNNADEPDEDDE